MSAERTEPAAASATKCNKTAYKLSEDIKNRYFPAGSKGEGFDVLPLYALDDYNRRLMHSLSILENPSFAKKWKDYKDDLPYIARRHEVVTFVNKQGTAFVNYRKKKVPLDFQSRFYAKPSPEAVFHNKNKSL